MALADPSTARLGYRPELDGIRALAVIAVVLYHSRDYLGSFDYDGGHLGVDAFFVLSGFLITTLLEQERRRTGGVNLRAFYARRALRLLPALFVTLVLGAVVVLDLGSNLGERPYRLTVVAVVLYVANWLQVGEGLGLLSHTWSLGIEEQYYLLWPGALGRARRRIRTDVVAVGLAAAALGIAVLRWRLYRDHPRFSDYSTLTRCDGVLLGSALALGLSTHREALARVLARSWVGLTGAAIAVGATFLPDGPLNFYDISATNIGTATVIGHLVTGGRGWLARGLSLQPLPVIGRMSYGIYLYHLPLNFWIHRHPVEWTGAVSVLAVFAATFAMAAVSFLFIERPILGLKARFEPPGVPGARSGVHRAGGQ